MPTTYTSAMMKAVVHTAVHIPIQVAHPLKEFEVICFDLTPSFRNLDVEQRVSNGIR